MKNVVRGLAPGRVAAFLGIAAAPGVNPA